MYYLTADERLGDLMSAVTDSDHKLYEIDPMRLAQPRGPISLHGTGAPQVRSRLDGLCGQLDDRVGAHRQHRLSRQDQGRHDHICALPDDSSRPLALGYDPATGIITSECDSTLRTTNHLMTIMGGFEIMNEIMDMIPDDDWRAAWLEHATHYKRMAAR